MIGHSKHDGLNDYRAAALIAPSLLVFWGSALVFSDFILRVIEAEGAGIKCRRIDGPDDLIGLCDPSSGFGGAHVRMVFIDDSTAPEVFPRIDHYQRMKGNASWVLAYRDSDTARQLLKRRQQAPALQDFLLLPMNVPIGTWTPMLQLVLAGDFFVPGALLPKDRADKEDAISDASSDCTAPAAAPSIRPDDSCNGLTPREHEVLALVAKGERNKTIAHRLALSEHTVKLHLHHAITKIGARNRTEAANWYLTRRSADLP